MEGLQPASEQLGASFDLAMSDRECRWLTLPMGHGSGTRPTFAPHGNGRPAAGFALGRLLVSGPYQRWAGPANIEVITAPSASHAAQMGNSPQPTAGPGLGKVVPSVGTTGPLPSSHLNVAT
jgi:hypothetical protein